MLNTTNTSLSFSASCSDLDANGMTEANFSASYSNGGRIYFSIDAAADADMKHVMDDFEQFKDHVMDTISNL